MDRVSSVRSQTRKRKSLRVFTSTSLSPLMAYIMSFIHSSVWWRCSARVVDIVRETIARPPPGSIQKADIRFAVSIIVMVSGTTLIVQKLNRMNRTIEDLRWSIQDLMRYRAVAIGCTAMGDDSLHHHGRERPGQRERQQGGGSLL